MEQGTSEGHTTGKAKDWYIDRGKINESEVGTRVSLLITRYDYPILYR